MFIDGFDEFEGRYEIILNIFSKLTNRPHVKRCMASRPLLAFENAFGSGLNLQLQDLTYRCIRAYAELQLSDLIQQNIMVEVGDNGKVVCLMKRIVERADGVFLWAVIVIRLERRFAWNGEYQRACRRHRGHTCPNERLTRDNVLSYQASVSMRCYSPLADGTICHQCAFWTPCRFLSTAVIKVRDFATTTLPRAGLGIRDDEIKYINESELILNLVCLPVSDRSVQ